MTTPPEYPYDPSQQPYGQQPQQPQQPHTGGHPGMDSGGYHQGLGQGYGAQQAQPGYTAAPATPAGGTSFFGALFDFSFREFVTSRVIKVLYVLWLIGIGLGVVSGLVSAIASMSLNFFVGFLMLLAVLVGGAIAVLLSRVVLELLIVVFRISEDLGAIRQRGGM
ncbi:DUF4282 domain-containing protein [Nocardiopsis alkaliphila]|uniref:DUF4282 domain-containing protein n=1 Tax=Nocardiopsis alkaliphila TaxID=225762 RepID=UPI00034C3DEA|nr:DUF4282 domain-containing protein [Nocardiopsis alkaliphila]